ncbi:MAG: MarR family winged helix-turn-helix transcriptional regulator [Eubacteriales bacterium]|nr:MarR family winged helix-turn-helix transcriptional regulator [Eubacteriales bacterium]
MSLDNNRFLKFTLSVSRMNKRIQSVKTVGMGRFGLKAAHTTVLYILSRHPEGLHFSEVADRCDLDRALISRTLSQLTGAGMVEKQGDPGRYNALYFLTQKGNEQTGKIIQLIEAVQSRADEGIDPEELEIFYRVLNRLLENFGKMEADYDAVFGPEPGEKPEKASE